MNGIEIQWIRYLCYSSWMKITSRSIILTVYCPKYGESINVNYNIIWNWGRQVKYLESFGTHQLPIFNLVHSCLCSSDIISSIIHLVRFCFGDLVSKQICQCLLQIIVTKLFFFYITMIKLMFSMAFQAIQFRRVFSIGKISFVKGDLFERN